MHNALPVSYYAPKIRETGTPSAPGRCVSNGEIVAHCKMGGRSAKAVAFLKQASFTKVYDLTGGISAWAERIGLKMPKY
jgi:rhodanese-related sulfurtransferase